MSNDIDYINMRQKGFSDPVYGTDYKAFAIAAKKSLIENPVNMNAPSPYQKYLNQLNQSTFTKHSKKGGKTKRKRRQSKSRRVRK